MSTSYATTSDYREQTGDIPAELTRGLLESASRRIDRALIGARYPVDERGMPRHRPECDPTGCACSVRCPVTALRTATCAQAEDWIDTGDLGTGNGVTYGDLSIGSVRISRNAGAAGNQPSGVDVARKALDVLFGAGLLPVDPIMVG